MAIKLLNKDVRHRQFGAGVIIEQTDTQIVIDFGEAHGVKKFFCPAIFETFIEMSDPAMQKKVEDEIERHQAFNKQVEVLHKEYEKKKKREVKTKEQKTK
jgi:hypothetical protein